MLHISTPSARYIMLSLLPDARAFSGLDEQPSCAQLQEAQQPLVERNHWPGLAHLEADFPERDAEMDRLKSKLTQLHQQATEKVNRANSMLQERDAQIHKLKSMAEERQDQSNFLGIIKSLEDQVQVLEAELGAKKEIDSNEEPVVIKSESQRAAAPPPAAAVDVDRLRQLEAELQQAKINLNDQQAEFEKLLAKQAEEMTMEFERMFQKQAHIVGEEELKQEIAQLKADLEEKIKTCNSLKRLIEQQDEVVAEQKKVLEAQTSSATFAVENMQKMLKEAQQKLKENLLTIQSKDAANAELLVQFEAIKKQMQSQEMEMDEQNVYQKQKLQAEIQRVRDDCRREIDALKAKQLIQNNEAHQKQVWELQDKNQRLVRELEDRVHSVDMKDKAVAQLTSDLREKQKTMSSMQTKMDRMENAIMAQENLLQEANRVAADLRIKISSLERAAEESIHESELGAFEELAMVKNRLRVLEGEYEAMKNMVANKKPDLDISPISVKKQGVRAQRSTPSTPTGDISQGADQAHMMASSDLCLAQLEMQLKKEKDRADAAEHAATQLKVDLLMYEEKYEEDWQDQLVQKKHELLVEIKSTAESCRHAEEQIHALQLELAEERRLRHQGKVQVDDEKMEMRAMMEMIQSREQSPASKESEQHEQKILRLRSEESERHDQKILLLRLEEADGRCTDMQARLDKLFEKNIAVENKSREAEIERKRAVDGQEKYKEEISILQKDMAEEQKKVLQYENLLEKLQREKRDMSGEILVLRTDATARVQMNTRLKEQNSTLSEFIKQDKDTIEGLQADLDALRDAKSKADQQMQEMMQEMFAKVTKLEEMLRDTQSQRDALQEEKRLRDVELRVVKNDLTGVLHARDALKEQINSLLTEVAKAQAEESRVHAEMKEMKESGIKQILDKEQLIQTLTDQVKKLTADLDNERTNSQKLAGAREELDELVQREQSQVAALEKEKRLAMEQASLDKELLAKETEKALTMVSQLTAELKHVKTQLEVLEAEKEAQIDQIQTLERKYADASGKQDEKAVLERNLVGAESEMKVMLASKRVLEDKVRHFEMQEKAWKLSEDNLNAHIRQQKEALDKSNSELEKSARDVEVSQQKRDELKSMCDELKAAGADAVQRHREDVSLREDELRNVESELAAAKRELTDSKSRLENQVKMLEAELKQSLDAKSSAALLGDSLKRAVAEISKLSAENISLREQINELQDLFETKKADIAMHDERLVAAESEIQSLTKEKMSKLVESAKLLADLHAAKSDSSNITMRLHSSIERQEDMKMQIEALALEKTELQHEIERFKQENESLAKKISALQSEVNRVSSNGTDVLSENTALSNELQIYKDENEKLTRMVKSGEASELLMQKMKQSWQDEKARVESETRVVQAELALLSSRLEAAHAAERELLQQQSKLASEVDGLRAENEKLRAQAEAIKLDEQASGKQKSSGSASNDAEALKEAQEQIKDLLSQREIMVDELSQRKRLIDSVMKEAEETMRGAEMAVRMKSSQIDTLVSAEWDWVCIQNFPPLSDCQCIYNTAETAAQSADLDQCKLTRDVCGACVCFAACLSQSAQNQKYMMEMSMHKAESEALIEERTKVQRQLMALQADKETLEEKLRNAGR
jgi:chromosome segregation ATPase